MLFPEVQARHADQRDGLGRAEGGGRWLHRSRHWLMKMTTNSAVMTKSMPVVFMDVIFHA